MKKHFIKIISILMVMLLTFSACGSGNKSNTSGSHVKKQKTTVDDILQEKTGEKAAPTDNSAGNDNSNVDKSDKNKDAGVPPGGTGSSDKNIKKDDTNKNNAGQTAVKTDTAKGNGQKSSSQGTKKTEKAKDSSSDKIDVDLTVLSPNMVYSEVFSMMAVPQEYLGKRIKMKGLFAYCQDTQTKKEYFACIIQDALACCAQGIEFELEGKHKYPRDYPRLDEEFCVEGVFEEYEENGLKFYKLGQAKFVK